MLCFYFVVTLMHVTTSAFGVSSLKDPPLNVKKETTPVLPLLFFLLASNVEASYQRKGNSPNGTWRKTSERRAPGRRETCLLASMDR